MVVRQWLVVSLLVGMIAVRPSRSAFLSKLSTPRRSRPLFSHHNNDHDQERQGKQAELDAASTLSLAPMMEYTDRHFRHLVRLISNRTLLYTEMVGASAIYHEQMDAKQAYQDAHPTSTADEDVNAHYKDRYLQRFLRQSNREGPCVLQLGGSDPTAMYHATETVMELTQRGGICDYTAINLNCGCPSPKVAGKGCFGAALMDDPKLVADLVTAIHEGCQGRLPVTVKCRIGTDSQQPFSKQLQRQDDEQEYRTLAHFIETVADSGIVTSFDVHARIAVLQKSFSPADNRKIPPLKYSVVQRLVNDYSPHNKLKFTLNGGIETIPQAQSLLQQMPGLQGIMIGRAWAADPWRFSMADTLLYHNNNDQDQQSTSNNMNRLQILEAFGRHADQEEQEWDPIKIRRFLVKAVMPLFAGEPNSKQYRIRLDELARIPKQLHAQGIHSMAGQPPLSELMVNTALDCLSEETLLRTPQESYQRFLEQEASSQLPGRPHDPTVAAWQADRKSAEAV
ncbi:dihydrouridine(20/20a) synthase [Seminavis robusta]|uniref:Dihydrouridine(20/20a) synthase n=1 Tax=Seminavis robusta TaxID=568900 RepID=A0A9N8H5H2_9STRA|nr:dihydrouridine(20/20a) synthase [Seminavis robusta]|eukprot:Sro114_g056340.1 dihydrouridine(20/20a) synthase (509) ;mRNA; f:39720-41246